MWNLFYHLMSLDVKCFLMQGNHLFHLALFNAWLKILQCLTSEIKGNIPSIFCVASILLSPFIYWSQLIKNLQCKHAFKIVNDCQEHLCFVYSFQVQCGVLLILSISLFHHIIGLKFSKLQYCGDVLYIPYFLYFC